MNARSLSVAIAAGRVLIGLGAIIDPSRALAPWIGPDSDRTSNAVLARALGGRDLVIGAGALRSLGDPDSLRPWLAAGVLADVVDFGATAAASDLPWRGRAFVLAVAGAAAAGGAIALASLDAET